MPAGAFAIDCATCAAAGIVSLMGGPFPPVLGPIWKKAIDNTGKAPKIPPTIARHFGGEGAAAWRGAAGKARGGLADIPSDNPIA